MLGGFRVEDFRKSNLLLKNEDSNNEDIFAPFTWRVYENYGGARTEAGIFSIRAGGTRSGTLRLKRSYEPLVDEPDLFLKFARIPEKAIREKTSWLLKLFEWIHDYGLLGLTPDTSKSERLFKLESQYTPEVSLVPKRYSPEGGPGELIEAVIKEMWTANYVLTLYEAALSEDVDKIGELLLFEEDDNPEGREKELRQVRRLRDQRPKDLLSFEEALLEHAMLRVLEATEFKLSLFTYPVFRSRVNRSEKLTAKLISTAGVTPSWGARNLLGAMYLQFYWLITSNTPLCEYCGHLVPQNPALDGEGKRLRKTHSNKKFCSDACRHNYHYHNRRKLKSKQ